MSRLDIYKKQAKQLVRWHREGNYSIGGRILRRHRIQRLATARVVWPARGYFHVTSIPKKCMNTSRFGLFFGFCWGLRM